MLLGTNTRPQSVPADRKISVGNVARPVSGGQRRGVSFTSAANGQGTPAIGCRLTRLILIAASGKCCPKPNRQKYRYNSRALWPSLYREIPGFMLNESYAYLENRKRRKISALDFRHKLTSIFPSFPAAISGDFWAGPAAHSEASLGTPLPQGSKSYAINELDGEPTPSRGSARARLQGNHHVDFQRAGRCDQPLRQGKPGHVASRCGDGGPGSPLHAREGKTVM